MDAAVKISDGHRTMLEILEARKMRLDASLTFWNRRDLLQLTSYLLKTNDNSLYHDVIPQVTRCIKEENEIGKMVTLGMCLELLPAMQMLLKTKFEVVMCHRWYLELKDISRGPSDLQNQSLSLSPIHFQLMNMRATVKKLCRRDGKLGERAKVLHDLLDELS